MKRLSELGVSPAPWSRGGVIVRDKDGELIVDTFISAAPMPDARLVAAAPDLYHALREAVIESCHDCNAYVRDGNRCAEVNSKCFIQRWRKTLEKAGGAE